MHLARHFLVELDTPIILLGGINRLDTIKSALDEGFAFVAMARALLREPDLINRMRTGQVDEGLCIHCNRCMPSIYSGTRCVLIDPDPIETTTLLAIPVRDRCSTRWCVMLQTRGGPTDSGYQGR